MSDALPGPYWRLWWSSAVDTVGDGAIAAAVPLLAATTTSDPRLVALVSAATYLPWLLLSLPAGAAVDRYDRVALMWRAQAFRAVVVGVVAVLAALGRAGIPVLAAMAFALGAAEVVFGTAAQAVLPELVPARLLPRANGTQYTVTTVGRLFLGPPAGSLLFPIAVALPFGLDAVSFALSAALLGTLPRGPRRTAGRPSIRAGLRHLLGHRLLRTLALLLGVNTFCFQLGTVTLVLLATRTLHLDARGYGLLLAGGAVGSVVGGLVNARVVARIGALPALVVALAANVPVFAGIGLSPDAVVLGTLLALNGFLTTLWNVVTVSLRQALVPAGLLGRVTSVYRLLGWGLIPVGAVAGGLVAHRFGLRAPYPVAGALRGLALAVALPVLVSALRAGDQ
ncbi:MAG TPA: MFS transporter [Mycobacteriales bacterium]|nr:MFS transporter [Mycobacteriales bacterium]